MFSKVVVFGLASCALVWSLPSLQEPLGSSTGFDICSNAPIKFTGTPSAGIYEIIDAATDNHLQSAGDDVPIYIAPTRHNATLGHWKIEHVGGNNYKILNMGTHAPIYTVEGFVYSGHGGEPTLSNIVPAESGTFLISAPAQDSVWTVHEFSKQSLVTLEGQHGGGGQRWKFIPVKPTFKAPTRSPEVFLDNQRFTGTVQSPKTQSFLGIPFALPPVGDLRFRRPVKIPRYSHAYNVTHHAPACPQQKIVLPVNFTEILPILAGKFNDTPIPAQEDCLTLDVVRPASATSASNLPVVVWIFGGGFEVGSSAPSPVFYNGTMFVERSIADDEPAIYVAMNHRVSAFGFLASKEVRDAGVGNLGLRDQREALHWVQRYISAFGGDPTRVTLWGDSSGAISVSLQMLTNGGDTEGLFRAAIMQSGAPIPVGPLENGQKYYDEIVNLTGCTGPGSLECLRTIDYKDLKDAQDKSPSIFSYQSLVLAWLPREDGDFLTDNPQRLVLDGKVARVPIITGSVDDEGTMFSFSTLNVTTDEEVSKYIKDHWFTNATNEDLIKLNGYYPSAPTIQCLGPKEPISRQFKRIAAFQGDMVFQAPRRFFQQHLSTSHKQWAFLSKRHKLTPCLGAFHSSDLLKVWNRDLIGYLVNFVTHLDPNVGTEVEAWPQYTAADPQMMQFKPLKGSNITTDRHRPEAMQFLTEISLKFPI